MPIARISIHRRLDAPAVAWAPAAHMRFHTLLAENQSVPGPELCQEKGMVVARMSPASTHQDDTVFLKAVHKPLNDDLQDNGSSLPANTRIETLSNGADGNVRTPAIVSRETCVLKLTAMGKTAEGAPRDLFLEQRTPSQVRYSYRNQHTGFGNSRVCCGWPAAPRREFGESM
ncbi:MAG: hypothetical protein Q9159_000952 [Coniocarpon cinnabarinum]